MFDMFYMLYIHTAFFYYMLGNIPPAYRSSLKCIQLVTVVKYTDLIKYGIDSIITPFMDDLKSLEAVSTVIYMYITYLLIRCYLWFFRMKGLHLRFRGLPTRFEEP